MESVISENDIKVEEEEIVGYHISDITDDSIHQQSALNSSTDSIWEATAMYNNGALSASSWLVGPSTSRAAVSANFLQPNAQQFGKPNANSFQNNDVNKKSWNTHFKPGRVNQLVCYACDLRLETIELLKTHMKAHQFVQQFSKILHETILKFKEYITYENKGKLYLKAEKDPCWIDLSIFTAEMKTPSAIYQYIAQNNGNIKTMLTESHHGNNEHVRDPSNKFVLRLALNDFAKLLTVPTALEKNETAKLLPDSWNTFFNTKIRLIHSLKCEYNFDFITCDFRQQNDKLGILNGCCRCGNIIEIYFSMEPIDIVVLNCLIQTDKEKDNAFQCEVCHVSLQTLEILNNHRQFHINKNSNANPALMKTTCQNVDDISNTIMEQSTSDDDILEDDMESSLEENNDAQTSMPIYKNPDSATNLFELLQTEDLNEIVMNFKEKITVVENDIIKLKDHNDAIWLELSKAIETNKSNITLYAYVFNNTRNIRNMLGITLPEPPNECFETQLSKSLRNKALDETAPMNSQTTIDDAGLVTSREGRKRFTILVERNDFKQLVEETTFFEKCSNRHRTKLKMKTGIGQYFLSTKIWESQRQTCGYNFKRQAISLSGKSGTINAYCHCGSKLKCFIREVDQHFVAFYCETSKDQITGKPCKRVFLRGAVRKEIAAQLETITVNEFHKTRANDLIKSMNVNKLHVIKAEFKNQCDYCQAKFKSKKLLKSHIETQCKSSNAKNQRNIISQNTKRLGRPATCNNKLLNEVIMQYKDEITYVHHGEIKVKPKSDAVWDRLAEATYFIKTPALLYTYIQCNKFGIKDLLKINAASLAEDDFPTQNEELDPLEMQPLRGPRICDHELLKKTILQWKNKLFYEDKIKSKTDTIWTELSEAIGFVETPCALYTFVSCNKYGIKDLLGLPAQSTKKRAGRKPQLSDEATCKVFEQFKDELTYRDNEGVLKLKSSSHPIWIELSKAANNIKPQSLHCKAYGINKIREILGIGLKREENDDNIYLDESSDDGNNCPENVNNFTLRVPTSEYLPLLSTAVYGNKKRTVFAPGLWTYFLNQKIWESQQKTCVYYFKRHNLSNSGKSGHATGYCKCDSKLKCSIFEAKNDSTIMVINCETTEGSPAKKCGKLYLRKPLRAQIGAELQKRSIKKFRSEQASEFLKADFQPTNHTLAVLRSEFKKRKLKGNDQSTSFVDHKKLHLMNAESGAHLNECQLCELHFDSPYMLAEHIKTHNDHTRNTSIEERLLSTVSNVDAKASTPILMSMNEANTRNQSEPEFLFVTDG